MRDIDRLLGFEGRIRRKKRRELERFLSHTNERVRAYAASVAARDAEVREAARRERIAETQAELAWLRAHDADDPTWMTGHDGPDQEPAAPDPAVSGFMTLAE